MVVEPVRGTVLGLPAAADACSPLRAGETIPMGSTVDTRKGRVRLTSLSSAGGTPQTADFYDGVFRVTQNGAYTELALTEALAPCSNRARGGAVQEAEVAQAVGRRQGQVPHQGQLRRRNGPWHALADAGHVRRHAGPGQRRARSACATTCCARRSSSARASATWLGRGADPRPLAFAQRDSARLGSRSASTRRSHRARRELPRRSPRPGRHADRRHLRVTPSRPGPARRSRPGSGSARRCATRSPPPTTCRAWIRSRCRRPSRRSS